MIVWGAGVKGDLRRLLWRPAARRAQVSLPLAPGEDLQACDNGSSTGLKSNLAGLTGGSAGIKQGGLSSLISESLSCSTRNNH